jgi:formylglycine-generating enzyme required for sulfatase activity
MGSPDDEPGRYNNEGPQHKVAISSFYMGKYPIIQADYQTVMGSNPSYFKGDNLPAENVNWFDAIEYCNRLSLREGLTPAYIVKGTEVEWNRNADGYRLPTEAEWEYACRAGTTTLYYSGISVDNAGWYRKNSGQCTHPVGEKEPNAWGLYDMHGNVWEWCGDWYGGEYSGSGQIDPEGAQMGTNRVLRGGAWCNGAGDLRSAFRPYAAPASRGSKAGFRVARSCLKG